MPLAALVTAPYNYAMDDDGDGNFSASGNLSISIKDSSGATVSRTATLSACNAPYQVTLTSTAGTLTSQFGAPNSSTFSASTATYYFNAGTTPSACFAKPNLLFGDNNNVTGNGIVGINFSGPATQWDSFKGFKLQDITTPSSNFPTTGFNGAYFDITLANATAAQVITDSGGRPVSASSGVSNVTLALSAPSANVLRVELVGPSSGQTGGLGQVAVTGLPATFKLISGTTDIYTFTINKWFIPESGGHAYNGSFYPGGQTVPQYCASILGFKVPSILDYTNVFVSGTGVGGNYTRAINGGIFAEWGRTDNTYYTNSDWELNGY